MEPDAVPIGDWLHQGTSDPEEIADRYDDWAERYDDDLASWSYQAPAVVAETVIAASPTASAALDVGCGTGLVGRELRERGFGGRIVGLDISEASLAVARLGGAYDSLQRADLQRRLPFDDDAFDVVVCVGVMTYLPDVEQVWRRLARVTQPGGLVVLTQRDDLWTERDCQRVVELLEEEGVWVSVQVAGPAPYLPQGYGGTPEVSCYYLTAKVG
jgi:predicted TPR repeat methyltransferase